MISMLSNVSQQYELNKMFTIPSSTNHLTIITNDNCLTANLQQIIIQSVMVWEVNYQNYCSCGQCPRCGSDNMALDGITELLMTYQCSY